MNIILFLDDWVIVFDVCLKDYKRNFVEKVWVVFEMVDLNEGLGYNNFIGSGGIYVFNWIILIILG